MGIEQPPITVQQAFWNEWNASNREKSRAQVSLDQADVVLAWLERLGRTDLRIVDVGCGAGWLCSRLTPFGDVTGTDLSDDVLARAAKRLPEVRFVAGNFMDLDLGVAAYDVVISLEVLSHVADQSAFLHRISTLLKPGGCLMMATQNKTALMRNTVRAQAPGQLRRWVDHVELRRLLTADFRVEELFSITPQFNQGVLRILHSGKLKRLIDAVGLGAVRERAIKLEQRLWLGWTLMALARKPLAPSANRT